ncbi:MAG: GFA family protein [Pseudomonadota bacterium]
MSTLIKRIASCACGDLQVAATGEPERVSSCSCTDCQKRTGSVFGVTSFFQADQVEFVSGTPKTFRRGADSGNTLSMNFCPECGTTLYWTLEAAPGRIVIAVGCFADPEFPQPERHVWAKRKHHWVSLPDDCILYDEAP